MAMFLLGSPEVYRNFHGWKVEGFAGFLFLPGLPGGE